MNTTTRTTRTIATVTAVLATALALAGSAHADPAPPIPPGCVIPENGLPCSSQLQDVNAAIQRELHDALGGIFAPTGK